MIYIITPVRNRMNYTQKYLDALSKQSYKNFKVIIIDDGSTDGTSSMIKKFFPNTILLKGDGNLWWAEATNQGVKYALKKGASYILTLNDDTIPHEDFLEKMVDASKKIPFALIGAFAIDALSNEPVYGGEIRSWNPLIKTKKLLTSIPKNQWSGLKEVNIFPGRGLLIPSKVFLDIGLYDSKHFPQTYADYDFTYRAIKAGYKIYCNFDAKIKIYPEESSGMKFKKEKNIKNFTKHLFSIKGGGNLKFFTICVIKNSPKIYLLPYLIRGWMARIIGYWFK